MRIDGYLKAPFYSVHAIAFYGFSKFGFIRPRRGQSFEGTFD